jgi:uncharacterized iron-regulated membrane protein
MRLLDLLHRWCGALIGLVLAVLGLTGTVLVHRDAWVAVPGSGDPLVRSTEVIAATTERLMADPATRPEMITFASETLGVHRLTFGEGAGAYADQTGAIVIGWQSQWERPELWLFDLHHHLFAGHTGEIVAGIAGIAGLLFVLSGCILWWRTRRTFEFRPLPKRLTRPAILRHHRDLGIVMAPLLLLALFTGATMVFRPMAAILLGPSAPAAIDASLKPPAPRKAEVAAQLDWQGMIRIARARFPDADIRSISLPRRADGLITLRLRRPMEWLPNGRTTLWFAADSGRLVAARDAATLPAVVRGYNMLYPLHAAKVGGLPYRLVMTATGLALTMLGTLAVWTFWSARAAKGLTRRARSAIRRARA